MAHHKPHLPEKHCAHCQQPMVWRKAWRNCWETVKYCNNACQRLANRAARRAGAFDAPAEPAAPALKTQRFKRSRKVLALPKN